MENYMGGAAINLVKWVLNHKSAYKSTKLLIFQHRLLDKVIKNNM